MSRREIISIGILVAAGLALGLGVLWIVTSSLFPNNFWATFAQNLLTIITNVATIGALSSILTLWPDVKKEARRDITNSMREFEGMGNAPVHEKARVVANIRRRVREASFTWKETLSFLQGESNEDRLAGLCIVQGQWLDKSHSGKNRRDLKNRNQIINKCFKALLHILIEPRRPFEHYQATVAMQAMLSDLSKEQVDILRKEVNAYLWNGSTSTDEWNKFKTAVNQAWQTRSHASLVQPPLMVP